MGGSVVVATPELSFFSPTCLQCTSGLKRCVLVCRACEHPCTVATNGRRRSQSLNLRLSSWPWLSRVEADSGPGPVTDSPVAIPCPKDPTYSGNATPVALVNAGNTGPFHEARAPLQHKKTSVGTSPSMHPSLWEPPVGTGNDSSYAMEGQKSPDFDQNSLLAHYVPPSTYLK